MDEILYLHLSQNKLTQLNACRLYLQILHLSDITYPDGKTINSSFILGHHPDYPRAKYNWPQHTKPSARSWKL